MRGRYAEPSPAYPLGNCFWARARSVLFPHHNFLSLVPRWEHKGQQVSLAQVQSSITEKPWFLLSIPQAPCAPPQAMQGRGRGMEGCVWGDLTRVR